MSHHLNGENYNNRLLIGRYHEIGLKGGNRWRFVRQLEDNMRAAMADCGPGRIHSEGPRLMVELPAHLSDELAAERAALIFGLQNFTISRRVELELEAIKRAAIEAARGHENESFRVRARRDDKRFPLNSLDIEREVGAAVKDALKLRVDLTHPELAIIVEVLPRAAYVSAAKYAGPGGLPVGTGGRGLVLLSGGIDSPVAAHRMMRRGLRVDFVHFHAWPLVTKASQEKARELAAMLTRYQFHATLMQVAFGEIQREIVARAARPLRVVLYRRFMMRIASALAVRVRASALITGESLGQVASQTLDNMAVIEQAAALPILRPLVGMDKNEIVDQARAIGTFDTSILPDQDCCSLFVPLHPETHARLKEVEQAEAAFDIPAIVEAAIAATERVRLSFPSPAQPEIELRN